jgi:hypothetical protein
MKHFAILLFTLLQLLRVCSSAQAQVNNCGFEQLNQDNSISYWGNIISIPSYIDSAGNLQSDSVVWNQNPLFCTPDAHNGLGAMEIRNGYDYTINESIAGNAFGMADSFFTTPFIPIQSHPIDFSFYYKFYPVTNDTAYAFLTLLDSWLNPVGEAQVLISDSATTYTLASAPITYIGAGANAAKIRIEFGTNYAAHGHVAGFGTRLLVDDVNFTTVTGIQSTNKTNDLDIAPNPVQNELTIDIAGRNTTGIYSLSGQKLATFFDQSKIDVSGLTTGTYLIHITTPEKKYVTQFIKQ